MGYVGNQTTTAFTSMAKQDITGDGGQNYTLSHAVANAQEIEVFVNNVRQEPGVAYTVSGTALSMTGNVASTDDFYVVYQGKAVQTANHPATQPLSATTGTFNRTSTEGSALTLQKDGTTFGTLGVDGSDLVIDGPSGHTGLRMTTSGLLPRQNGAIIDNTIDLGSGAYRYKRLYLSNQVFTSVIGRSDDTNTTIDFPGSDVIEAYTAGVKRMNIDANGYVTMPNVPAFHCTSDSSTTSTGAFILGSTDKSQTVRHHVNGGGHHNTGNGRFTAPVSGHYFFSAMATPSQGANSGIRIEKNGSAVAADAYIYGQSYNGSSVSCVVYMAANDYANGLHVPFNGTTEGQYSGNFTGFLIG